MMINCMLELSYNKINNFIYDVMGFSSLVSHRALFTANTKPSLCAWKACVTSSLSSLSLPLLVVMVERPPRVVLPPLMMVCDFHPVRVGKSLTSHRTNTKVECSSKHQLGHHTNMLEADLAQPDMKGNV